MDVFGTIIAAIIAAVVAFITSHLTSYTNVTTQSRIDWIQHVRDIAIYYIVSIKKSINGAKNQTRKQNELFIKLKMYLNPCVKIDRDIIETAEKCLKDFSKIDDFSNMIQAYLKTEWERAKYESKGKKYDEYMFALKYNECLSKINESKKESHTEEGVKKVKGLGFKNFMFKANKVLNFAIKLAVFVLMVLLIIVIIYCIKTHSPYSDICKYLGI